MTNVGRLSSDLAFTQEHGALKKWVFFFFFLNAHLLTCHLALTAHGAVDVAACLPTAMEQLHYLLVNSSVRRSLRKA